jgi:DNA-directed RNA polymerase subunit omega
MINDLKDDLIIEKVGGRFRLASLMMKRWIELMQNARPMIDPGDMGELEIIAREIMEDKVAPRTAEPRRSAEQEPAERDEA